MRVALVFPAPPHPQGGAVDRCALGLLDGLSEHGIDIAGVAADLAGPSRPPVAEVSAVRSVPVTAPSGLVARLHHLHRPLGDLSRTRFAATVREEAAHCDLMHLETSLTTWLDEGTSLPALVSLHYRARLDRPLRYPWRPEGRELVLFRWLERHAIRRYRWLTASSDVVAASIRADRPAADVTVVGLSLRPDDYPPAPVTADRAGIIGTAGWPPTDDAVHRLLSSVWPAVRRAAPGATLSIAGRGMDHHLQSDVERGVTVVGEVPSAQQFLATLGVLLYPVRRGSGMKVKVLEAMASGVPIVTTRAGAEGVAPNDGVVVADDDEGLTRAAVDLLSNTAERVERGRAARAAFEAHHSPRVAAEPLADLYRRILY